MVEDTMFSGESKNIEYKVSLPDKSEKYMKTIVAFANTQGGKLIVGVDDKTHQIVGVENDVLFQLMDGIANAVSDSCVPQIIPDIEPQTVDGKTVIVVSVEAGKNRPYYLKSKGKDNGTYIRVAGTSRQAFPEKIKELEMEGARISWDELTCVGYPVSEEATEKLCQDIEKFRKKAGMSEHSVKKEQLINWKILKQSEGQLLATNAYALLTSDYFSFSKTQCAVFKGTDRAMFLDKREFTGPIYTQIEEAVDFVLRNIRLGATIDGLVRKEKYELPPEAIREAVVVGDPLQVEPVVTIPKVLIDILADSTGVANEYKVIENSVQTFADNMNEFNGMIGERQVGCPLVVHRRCIEPMFSISNMISYDNRMFNKTNKKEDYLKQEQPFLIKKSGWINVEGTENGSKDHFVKNQAGRVCQLLESALHIYTDLFDTDDKIFIITP